MQLLSLLRHIIPYGICIVVFSSLLTIGCGRGGGGASAPIYYFSAKTYGGAGNDIGLSVTQTNDGGYLAIGTTNSGTVGDYDVLLIRTDSTGKQTQKVQFGTTGNDIGFAVMQTSDGGFIATGLYNYPSSLLVPWWFPEGFPQDFYAQLFLRKLDSNLNLQWESTPNLVISSMGYSVQQTTDGGYIVGGAWGGSGNGSGVLVKMDSVGAVQWNVGLGVKGISGVRQTIDGGYVVSVADAGGVFTGDFIAKVDASGNTTWQTVLNGSSQSVWNTSTGDYVITGTNPLPTAAGNLYLAKISSTGTILWEKAFGGGGGDEGLSIQETSDLGYIATGWGGTLGFNTYKDVYLVKTDGNGVLQWEKSYGGMGDEVGRAVRQTADGGYIVTGFTNSTGAGGYDLFLLKVDSNGNNQW
jgi:hypothetical protein